MATTDRPKSPDAVPLDLLPVLRRSGVLNDRQFDEIKAKVLRGDLPHDSRALAERLVQDNVLTEYQARKLLNNRPHGLVVSRYVILDRLGSGSMGRVYKAYHRLMGRLVALKIIAPEIASNARIVARFQREMRLVGRLDHPNVVRAYDAEQEDGVLLLAMEYVPGQSLGQRLRTRGVLSPAETINYAAQAARGLGHAHKQGIVHRDIKPSNLLLTVDRQVKILDLGLGVLMQADDQATFATADGVAVGTIDYMSPEQACGKDVDGRSDLYSLGCAMYHLMTGQLAFPGDSPIERLGKRINGRPVPITDLIPDLPPRAVRTLDKLMATRPQDRFQTADEAAEALQSLTRRKSAPVARPTPESPPGHPTTPEPTPVPAMPGPPATPLPTWFRPFASVVERSPAGALILLLVAAMALFTGGFVLGLQF